MLLVTTLFDIITVQKNKKSEVCVNVKGQFIRFFATTLAAHRNIAVTELEDCFWIPHTEPRRTPFLW